MNHKKECPRPEIRGHKNSKKQNHFRYIYPIFPPVVNLYLIPSCMVFLSSCKGGGA